MKDDPRDIMSVTFDKIYSKYSRLIMEICLGVLKNKALADDAFQLACIAIVKNIDKVAALNEKARRYIIKTARSCAIDVYRSYRNIYSKEIPLAREREEDDEEDDSHEKRAYQVLYVDSFEEELFRRYDRIKLLESLKKLDGKKRSFILDRFYGKMSMKQIAEKHGISEEATKKRVSRSLDELRKIYFKE